jgi:hypothetical protein
MKIEKIYHNSLQKWPNQDIFKEIQRAPESNPINKKSPNLVTLLPSVNALAFKLQHQ